MEKRYDFTHVEKQMQAFWEREQFYRFDINASGRNDNSDGAIYSIDTPPPTVSGSLHIGHLFSYVQAEMIARFQRMQGRNVFYPFGFDDNGLPTERLVERDTGIRANAVPREEFAALCKSVAGDYENAFIALWKSLGFSADWTTAYQTVSPDVCKISQELFLELVRMGKAYVKESPVLWCVECQTSIAQAELDTADLRSAFNYIPFFIGETPLMVATTRPELLYGCVCLFVHPDDGRYKRFAGKTAVTPLYGHEIPILTDAKVGIDKGTGVVMCATFGDGADAEWYEEHNLPYRRVITQDGKIDGGVPFIGGLDLNAARVEIIRLLGERGLLQKTEEIVHAVGIHERCGRHIEIIPSRQWYIDILSERERFIKAADEINWYPASMKNRYIAWVENLKWDWCISRQRYFGVPFPVWYCKDCGKPAFAKKEQLPKNPLDTVYEGVCECGCAEFLPESAVFDTWATSSITPQINERLGIKLVPMSMRTHAHDIIRSWTFYTMVRSLYHAGCIPWKDLMICGFILAKKGEKIGKSKNNDKFDPQNLIAEHSADALRYWTAGARLGTDTYFSPDDLTIPKRFITKLWNASGFSLSRLHDFDPRREPKSAPEPLPVDRWIMERADETSAKAAALLYEYEIGAARHEIDAFFWKDFCDNYIEIAKERLYEPAIHGEEGQASGLRALYYALFSILKLYSIYVPHITEYIYQNYFRQYEGTASIHLTRWAQPSGIDAGLIRFGERLKAAVSDMRKYKSERNLSMRAEMEIMEIRAEQCYADWFMQSEKDIVACSRAKKIVYMWD